MFTFETNTAGCETESSTMVLKITFPCKNILHLSALWYVSDITLHLAISEPIH